MHASHWSKIQGFKMQASHWWRLENLKYWLLIGQKFKNSTCWLPIDQKFKSSKCSGMAEWDSDTLLILIGISRGAHPSAGAVLVLDAPKSQVNIPMTSLWRGLLLMKIGWSCLLWLRHLLSAGSMIGISECARGSVRPFSMLDGSDAQVNIPMAWI